MRVLITGASGFLGSHLAAAFLQHGHSVRALVRPDSPTRFLKSLPVELVVAGLNQPDRLRAAAAQTDLVIHAAAQVNPLGPWRDFHTTTIEGTRHMLQAAATAGARQFIHISSRGVYEQPARPGQPYDESCAYGHPYRWSYYARAKIAAEHLVRAAQTSQLIATTILRPTWIYGPRDTTIFTRIATALRARRLRWIGDAQNTLNLVYVTDVANAALRAATNPKAHGQIYNVAADETSVTQQQFLTQICRRLDLPLPAATWPYRLAHTLGFASECVAHATRFRIRPPLSRLSVLLLGGHRHFSNRKLREELDWHPEVPFDQGIQQTVDWYRNETSATPTPRP